MKAKKIFLLRCYGAAAMIKEIIVIKFIVISLTAIVLNGCTFIIKDGSSTKYYGVDEKRGSEVLNKILDKQQEIYQAQKVH